MEFSFVTFNILANRFTNYNLGGNGNETISQMEFRYITIINILQDLNKDIYFLQEVDNHFYKLLMISPIKNNYFITYRYHIAWPTEKNKSDIGTIILVKNKSPISINKEIKDLNQLMVDHNPPNSKALQFRGGISGIYDFITLTKNGDEGNQRKFAHILITKTIHNSYLILINHHLEGRPDYEDLRIKEFQDSYHFCQQFCRKFLKGKKILYLMAGDFNEDNQTVVIEKIIDNLPLKLINDNSEDLTSYTKYSTDKLTNQRNVIDKKQKLDYLITSKEIKCSSQNMIPNLDFINFPNWDRQFIGKIKDDLVINSNNWPSDHKLLEFKLKIMSNVKGSLKKKKVLKGGFYKTPA